MQELRDIVEKGRKLNARVKTAVGAVPIAKALKDESGLLNVTTPKVRLADLVAPPDQSNSLIVCATNREQILDHALFRRFDDVVRYRLPGPDEILRVLDCSVVPARQHLGLQKPPYGG